MTTPRDWIRKQRDKAQRDYDDASNRLKTWTAALALVDGTQADNDGKEIESQEETELVTIGDYVRQVLGEHGPLRYAQIHAHLQKQGKDASATSINVHLNRYKGKLYYKTEDGRWHLRKKSNQPPPSTVQKANESSE